MPSAFSHIAVPLAIMVGCGCARRNGRLTLACMLCSVLPDLDSIAFKFGIAYESQWGHRGFTHSIVFALALAAAMSGLKDYFRASRRFVFAMIFIATLSHPILDALTDGGLGVALFWPFSDERYFLPWGVIEVSPISLDRFFGDRGLAVIRSELTWIWLPSLFTAAALWLSRQALYRTNTRKVKP